MLSLVFFALGILCIIALIIARVTKKPDFMRLMIRRKNDEMDDEYLKRATVSSVIWAVIFFVVGAVLYFRT
ncbi:MAG: hypothetical protein FWC47_06140 [Oscillospiraceae bacterium]|nr:hypothetical protein [Oscillospiraceae bacterium]